MNHATRLRGHRRLFLATLFCLVAAVALVRVPAAFSSGTIITFDVPGATNTIGTAINDAGTVGGFYVDGSNITHGFIRNTDGRFINADPPGATNTIILAINNPGTVIGWYDNATAGFVRDSAGNFTTFTPAGASITQPFAINDAGVVTGSYVGSDNVWHGFIRDLAGTITSFDVQPGTFPRTITQDGRIAGYYDYGGWYRSFVRDQLGQITLFAAPAAYYGTVAYAMNDHGQVAGQTQERSTVLNAFMRNVDGSLSEFSAPGAGKGGTQGSYAWAINDAGQVAGNVINGTYTSSCFVRDAFGRFTVFSAPGAGIGDNRGTYLRGLNNNGATTGEWVDGRGIQHGFVRF